MSAWLAAAYACLALGLGWSLASGARWRRRIPFIVAAPAVALALWLGRPDPAGWPTARGLPAHAGLVSALVREPDPATADRGRIYLWLDVGRGAPRAFSVPYTREAHRRVQKALGRLAHRQSVQLVRAARARGTRTRSGPVVGFAFGRRPPPLPAKSSDGSPEAARNR
jgi:hypothetical protein